MTTSTRRDGGDQKPTGSIWVRLSICVLYFRKIWRLRTHELQLLQLTCATSASENIIEFSHQNSIEVFENSR
ncbi:hypothetical protein QYF36_011132 [Acer negundo]|nr:hypothetical protein QYF36_011132 [Acer negundo]